MVERGDDGQIYVVRTEKVLVTKEQLNDAAAILTTEVASLNDQHNLKQDQLNEILADLVQLEELSVAPAEAPAEEASNVDDLIPDEDADDTAPDVPAPTEPTPEVAPEPVVEEPFDGGAAAPQAVETMSVEQAVEQGL